VNAYSKNNVHPLTLTELVMAIDHLVFVGLRGYVLALHRDSGEKMWEWAAPNMSATGFTSLVLDGDRLIAGINGYIFCLLARNGELLWENPLSGYGQGITCVTSLRAQVLPSIQGGGAAQVASDDD
jgi:outer membrane protein assembly factor BamB